ncbi:DUF1007 family protein [Kiloniella antarctica]|uniref:DUF1007 family protein n=1 Tax=Kiloniella antarctica TaxID=1550907 RepID=A0ABW5BKN3_9PROT
MRSPTRRFMMGLLLLALSLFDLPKAYAHPHVWVDAAVIIHRNDAGQIAAIEPVWIFDDLYTATLLPDLDLDHSGEVERSELLNFAQEAVHNLHEWGYFLSAKKENGQILYFEEKISTESVVLNNRLLLRFKLTLDHPIASSEVIELKMYDPSYFIAIELVKEKTVSFLGPDGVAQNQPDTARNECQSEVMDPSSNENNETPLSELFFSDEEIAENPDLGSIFAQILRVSCL